jgi:hypothetical protein
MLTSTVRYYNIEPTLRRRENGGWLAISEPGAPLRIGVEGATADEARRRFVQALGEWVVLLDERTVKHN